MDLSRKLFSSLIIVAGLSSCISLSLLSLVQSGLWLSWVDRVSDISSQYPIWRFDLTLLTATASSVSIAVIGAVLLVIAVASRSTLIAFTVLAIAILAQFPGIIASTKFQWMWLSANGQDFLAGPNMVVVGLALVSTPVGIYSLRAAAALEQVGKVLAAGEADPRDISGAFRSNFLLLVGVFGFALALGAVPIIPLTGLSGSVTGHIREAGPALIWMSVAGSILVMAFLYTFLYENGWPRAGPMVQGEQSEPLLSPVDPRPND